MESFDHNITPEVKRLNAINASLETRLGECESIIRRRDAEIEMLQAMVTESGAHRSNLDRDVTELKSLQQGLKELQQQVAASSYIGADRISPMQPVGVHQQLQDLGLRYTYLQTQLTDVEKQVLELTNKNLLLQQEANKVSSLESLLENAEQEIRELRERQPGKNTPPLF